MRVAFVMLLWLVAGLPGGLTLCLCWCPAEGVPPAGLCCEAEPAECCDADCSLELEAHPDPLGLPTAQTDFDPAPQLARVLAPFQPIVSRHVRAAGTATAPPRPFAQRSPELRL